MGQRSRDDTEPRTGPGRPLSPEEGSLLLRVARAALEQELCGGEALDRCRTELRRWPRLDEVRGVFVTLREPDPAARPRAARLRGCIGHIEGVEPLWKGVADNALHAGMRDPRFPPVTAAELDGVRLEVSVLTPLREAAGVESVRLGIDGLHLELEGRRGVFLPQVAPEQCWNLEETLDHLCFKAGLPAGSWRRPDARLRTFQAEVFAERDDTAPARPVERDRR